MRQQFVSRVGCRFAFVVGALAAALLWLVPAAGAADTFFVSEAVDQAAVSSPDSAAALWPLVDAGIDAAAADRAAMDGDELVQFAGEQQVVLPPEVVHEAPLGASWGRNAPMWIGGPDAQGWITIAYEDAGLIRARLRGRGSEVARQVSGASSMASGLRGGTASEVVVLGASFVESYVLVDGSAVTSGEFTLTWDLDLPEDVEAVASESAIVLKRQRGGTLVTISAPEARSASGRELATGIELASDHASFSVVTSIDGFDVVGEDIAVDPRFGTPASGVVSKFWCPDTAGSSPPNACAINNSTEIPEWAETSDSGSDNFLGSPEVANSPSWGMFLGARNQSIASGSTAVYRVLPGSGVTMRSLTMKGHNETSSGNHFWCRIRAYDGSGYDTGTWVSSTTNFTHTVTYTDGGGSEYQWAGFQQYKGTSGNHSGGASWANRCNLQNLEDAMEITVKDGQVPTSTTPASVSPYTITSANMVYANTKWYGADSVARVWYDVDDYGSGTGLGVEKVALVTNGTERSSTLGVVCTPDDTEFRPCPEAKIGYRPITLTTSNSSQGTNTVAVKVYDFAAQTATSGTSNYYFDSVAPSTPTSPSSATSTADGTALLSWTASTDSTSGVARYDYKVWPAHLSEPSAWTSSGSNQPYANVRLDLAASISTSLSQSWKWKVAAVDKAGNRGTATAEQTLTASITVLGAGGDETTAPAGGGISIGLASGNAAVSATDLTSPGYGVSMSASRTYNHQDVVRPRTLIDVATSEADASKYAVWSLGTGVTASWERRLVRGDNGTTIGHGAVENDVAASSILSLVYVDESGKRWPFTPTDSAATAFEAPVGLDASLTRTSAGASGPAGDTYELVVRGGETLEFDEHGRLVVETFANDRTVTYERDSGNAGRVTAISAEDPDGAGGVAALELSVTWGGSGTYRIEKIADALGREVRYTYGSGANSGQLTDVEHYASSASSTELSHVEHGYEGSGSVPRLLSVDQWIYEDDPSTSSGGADPLMHTWTIAYGSSSNVVDSVTEAGTPSYAIGTASEVVPATAATIVTPVYTSSSTGIAKVRIGTSGDPDAHGETCYLLDKNGLAVETSLPGEGVDPSCEPGPLTAAYSPENLPIETVAVTGDVTTTEYDADGDVALTRDDPAEEGLANTVTETSGSSDADAVDGSGLGFQALMRHDVGDCIQTGAYTWEVTSVSGTQLTGDEEPSWDASPVTSGEVTFTEQTLLSPCSPRAMQKTITYAEGDDTFIESWAYTTSDCIGVAGDTFQVTTAGTSASSAPTWPSSGTVSSGSVVFTFQACTPNNEGAVVSWQELDAAGNVTEEHGADGIRACSYYNDAGQVTQSYSLDGAECPDTPSSGSRIPGTLTVNTYNTSGFLTETETDTQTTSHVVNALGESTSTTLEVDGASADVVTETARDGMGRETTTTRYDWNGTSSVARTTTTEYNIGGQVISTTAPNSDETTHRFDGRGRGYLTELADGALVTRSHDAQGRELTVSVPHLGSVSSPAVTTLSWYRSGAKETKLDPAGILTEYDKGLADAGIRDDAPSRIEDPVRGVTTFAYDSSGEMVSKITAAGTGSAATTTADRNGRGLEQSTTIGGLGVRSLSYDSSDRVTTREFDPDAGSTTQTTFTYDDQDRPLTENQPSGIDTTNTYDANGQLDTVTLDADGSSWDRLTRHDYDAAGRTTSTEVEAGATDITTSFVYENASGRLKEIDRPDGHDERFAHDSKGRQTEAKVIADSGGTWVGGDTYNYNSRDQITSRTRQGAGGGETTTFTYDVAGQVTSETSADGIIRSYVYGDANSTSFGTDLQRQTLHVDTAPAGSLAIVDVDEIEDCLTHEVTHASCVDADEAAWLAAYEAIAQPGSTVDPAALTGADAEVAQWLALRDGRVWEATTAVPLGACVAPNGFGGDTYKVTSAGTTASSEPTWPGSGTVSDGSVTWAFDDCAPVLVLHAYWFDATSHQLTQHRDRLGATEYFHYDVRGNQDYRGSSAYAGTPNQTWDVMNRALTLKDDDGNTVTLTWYEDQYRLKTWAVGGVTRTLSYDANGRIVKIDATGSSSWTTEYAYDQAGLASFKTGGDWYYLDRSMRGDVLGVREDDGTLAASIRYAAYGEQWTDDTTLVEKLGLTYNGRDGVVALGAGLLWMQHRVYSAGQGRFVSADPEESDSGSLQSAYNYSDSNPISQMDPTGRKCWTGRGPSTSADDTFEWGGPRYKGNNDSSSGSTIQFAYRCNSAKTRHWYAYFFERKWSLTGYYWAYWYSFKMGTTTNQRGYLIKPTAFAHKQHDRAAIHWQTGSSSRWWRTRRVKHCAACE